MIDNYICVNVNEMSNCTGKFPIIYGLNAVSNCCNAGVLLKALPNDVKILFVSKRYVDLGIAAQSMELRLPLREL